MADEEGVRSKKEWLEFLRSRQSDSPGAPLMVAYGRGIKNVAVRLWPFAVVYRNPPVSLHNVWQTPAPPEGR